MVVESLFLFYCLIRPVITSLTVQSCISTMNLGHSSSSGKVGIYGDYCYFLHAENSILYWDDAHVYCTGITSPLSDTELPSVHHKDENAKIYDIGVVSNAENEDVKGVWLGYKNPSQQQCDPPDDCWEWTDSTSDNYENWYVNQPSGDGWVAHLYSCIGCAHQFLGEYWNDVHKNTGEFATVCKARLNWKCFGIDKDNSAVCTGNGDCEKPDFCDCYTGYYGGNPIICDNWNCFDVSQDSDDVCSGYGDCESPDSCTCEENYQTENDCSVTTCFEVLSSDQSKVCNGSGTCWPYNHCNCNTNFYGRYCEVFRCNEFLSNDTSNVCSGPNGICLLNKEGTDGNCHCSEDYYGIDCEVTTCHGIFSNETSLVCDGHGNCTSYNFCECLDNYYGENCVVSICDNVLSNNSLSEVCNGHGNCTSYNFCECNEFYYSEFCNITKCNNIFSNASDVCTAHGECISRNVCVCLVVNEEALYTGEYCSNWDCFLVENSNTDEVCSGHGNCTDYNHCDCIFGYFEEACEGWNCYGKYRADENVCDKHGVCESYNFCECHEYYSNLTCNNWHCNNIINYETEEVCSGHGSCVEHEQCQCSENWYGELDCNITKCDHILSNMSQVCKGHGNCVLFDTCHCQPNYYGKLCSVTKCWDTWNNDTSEICNSHGSCAIHNKCQCTNPNLYFGLDCNVTFCKGIKSNDSRNVCNGKGDCVEFDTCMCHEKYFGEDCEVNKCWGIFSNDTESVCNGHGNCTDYDDCVCQEKWFSSFCNISQCFGIFSNDSENVCSGKGTCYSGNCTCESDDYSGDRCQAWSCFNISRNAIEEVCASHGVCLAKDRCYCQDGYLHEEGEVGNPCTIWFCGGFGKDDEAGCNERGKCTSSNLCDCEGEYEGSLCDTWSCGFPKDSELTCSGHGTCLRPGECQCSVGFGGSNMCEEFVAIDLIIVLIIVSICCFSCVCVLCVLLISLIGLSICIVGCTVIGFRNLREAARVKNFEKLKNFNILMKEQEMEENTDIAHIRMRKDLYRVNYSDIEIVKLIGQGGSRALVFHGKWKSKDVAFKCFKTRMICSTQKNFDEFEKEVEVLSSLKHPFIVQFFGATVEDTRVGILMEYCEHGDLSDFLETYKSYNLIEFDQDEKIRMCYEISHAMHYLHSRNVVHRDLKCENVLVTKNYQTRLMDFGLSKIVERMSKVRTSKIGTNIYMAPEVISRSGYNEKCEEFEPYGPATTMVELKVSSNPNFRPDISILDNKLSRRNKWVKDIVERNWDHECQKRDSFLEISRIFEAKRKALLESSTHIVEAIDDDDDDEEHVNTTLLENEQILGENGLVFLPRDDFDDVKKYYEYLEEQVERVRSELKEYGADM